MMKNATMITVGLLMIAMLVGFGALTAGSLAKGYDWSAEDKVGQFLEAEDDGPKEHIHPQWDTDWKVVGSRGGACPCCGDCEPLPSDISVRV